MRIAFTTVLSANHWNADIGGWELSALRIPGAKVTGLFHEGRKLKDREYEVSERDAQVRLPEKPEGEFVVGIELERRLFSWVGTGTISALASIVVALITGYFSVAAVLAGSGPADTPSDARPATQFVRWQVSGELDFAEAKEYQGGAKFLISPPSWRLYPGHSFYVEFCEGPKPTDAARVYFVVQNEGHVSTTIPVSKYLDHARDFRIVIPNKIYIPKSPAGPYQPSPEP